MNRSLLLTVLAVATTAATPAVSLAQSNQQREFLLNLPDNAHVLYVLGDVNGDGVVDHDDLALLRQLAADPSAPRPAAVRCFAAGDVNLDRTVDNRDVDILARWLDKARQVDIPALYWQPGLSCTFGPPYLAASLDPARDETFVIRFLDSDYSESNCRAEIHRGPATIDAAPDHKGFLGQVASSAKAGDLIVVLLTLPNNRRYYYNLQVRAGPPID